MTRKRYIKLIMGTGTDRNTAAVIAKGDREAGFSYDAGWAFIKAFLTPPDFSNVELIKNGDDVTLRWVVYV